MQRLCIHCVQASSHESVYGRGGNTKQEALQHKPPKIFIWLEGFTQLKEKQIYVLMNSIQNYKLLTEYLRPVTLEYVCFFFFNFNLSSC